MRWGFFDAQLCRCSLASLLIQGCNHIHTGFNAQSSAVQAQVIVICLPPLSACVQLIEFLTLLIYAAEALGVDSTALEGIEFDKVDELLGLDAKKETCQMIVLLGYRDPNDSNTLDRRPKSRLSVAELTTFLS